MKSEYVDSSVYNSLFPYMTYENVLALRVALATGLRIGDVLKIRTDDIKGRTLNYVAEKTEKKGTKVLPQKLVTELRRNACGGWAFPGRKGGHRTRQAVWADVKKARKAVGLEANITPHSTRKTYAVDLYHEKGIEATERELQHDSLATTMLYAFSNVLEADAVRPEVASCKCGYSDARLKKIVSEAVTDALKAYARQIAHVVLHFLESQDKVKNEMRDCDENLR